MVPRALALLILLGASGRAQAPSGVLTVIAHRGVMQQSGRASRAGIACTATQIAPPVHDFLENTLPSLAEAQRLGAQMLEIDLRQTADGRVVLFHDADLACRTDGHGAVRDATLAQLKRLDAGYGYSADGGRSFPLRGKGQGLIATLDEVLAAFPRARLLYNVQTDDATFGDRLVAAIRAAGRDPAAMHDGFSAPAPTLAKVRAAWPQAWSYSDDELGACMEAYLTAGDSARVPRECQRGTLVVPLDRQARYAGWPTRLGARMSAAGGHVIVIGPRGDHGPMGLDRAEQVGEIPRDFSGYVWVDDMWRVGPAIRARGRSR